MKISLTRWLDKEYLKELGRTVLKTLARFPLPLTLFFILAGLMIWQIEIPYDRMTPLIRSRLDRLMAICGLGITLTLLGEVTLERLDRKKSLALRLPVMAALLGFLGLYYRFFFPLEMEMVPVVRLLILTLTFLLGFLFVPFWPERKGFEIYMVRLVSRLFVTGFYTLVLALGVVSILFAIENLLWSGMNNNLYLYTFIVSGLVFAPLFFLGAMPQSGEEMRQEDFGRIIRGLFLYIILPVLTAYTLVLYIYCARILITTTWPSGMVSYLVIFSAVAGILTVFILRPLLEESPWARNFSRVYIKALIPLLVMMFISIGMRLNQYGVTERRYYVLLIGVWLAFCVIWMNLAGKRSNLAIWAAMAALLVISVVGPGSAFSVSRASQNQRFEAVLSAAGRLEGGTAVPRGGDLTEQQQRQVYDIVDYFERFHRVDQLKALPEDFENTKAGFEELFGFTPDFGYWRPDNQYFSYWETTQEPVEVSGFDVLFTLQGSRGDRGAEQSRELTVEGRTFTAEITESWDLVIREEDRILSSLSIQELVRDRIERYGIAPEKGPGQWGPMVLEDYGGEIRVRCLVQSVDGQTPDGVEPEINYAVITVLLGVNP